jgi:hypothetical protein
MQSSLSSRHLLASLMVALALASASTALAQADDKKGAQQAVSTSDTVTHKEPPPPAGNHWTAEKMRKAKPFPMPSTKGPPVPQQVIRNRPAARPLVSADRRRVDKTGLRMRQRGRCASGPSGSVVLIELRAGSGSIATHLIDENYDIAAGEGGSTLLLYGGVDIAPTRNTDDHIVGSGCSKADARQ